MTLNEYCTGIADAIRTKEGSTGKIPAPEHRARILAIDKQEDLSPELAAQDTLIADIMTALEGKAAASVDTCTVTYSDGGTGFYIIYTTYNNGVFDNVFKDISGAVTGISLNNVVKNSLLICVVGDGINADNFGLTGGAEHMEYTNDDIADALGGMETCAIKITDNATVVHA